MKKTFHLDLDHSGVRLRHGSGANAPILGEIALDDPHFDTRLEDLRRDAQAMADGPLTTRITIPESEILFTSVTVPEDVKDDAARRKLIDAELDGQTPYSLDDLVIDWTPKSKTEIAVALVARETLDQAEDFAVAHGFNPEGFTAEPKKGLFRKRPDFGETAFAAGGGMAGIAVVEPEVTRIADVLNDAPPPAPTEPDDPPAPPPVAVAETGDGHDIVADPAGAAPASEKSERAESVEAVSPDKAPPEETPARADTVSGMAAAAATGPDATAAPRPGERQGTDDAGAATDADGAAVDEKGPSFSTSRSAGARTDHKAATTLSTITSRIASVPDGGAGPRPASGKSAPALKVTNGAGAARKPKQTARKAPTPSVRKVAPPAPGMTPKPANSPRPTTALSPGAASSDSAPRTEAEKMTVFGARRDVQQRQGLGILPLLIGLLVAFAIAIGIWAALFLLSPAENAFLQPDRDTGEATFSDPVPPAGRETAESAPDDPPASDVADEDVALLAPSGAAPVTDDGPTDATGVPETDPAPAGEADAAAGSRPAPDDPLQRPAGADESGRYAATGVETSPPPVPDAPATDRPAEVPASELGPDLRIRDSVTALSTAFTTPQAPQTLLPPPPPGQRFDLDEDGRVVATEDGALSPDGVRVTAGVPPLRPPPAPDRPTGTRSITPVSEADLIIPVNDGTPALRPRSRPGSDGQQDARRAPESGSATSDRVSRLAGVAPRRRPGDDRVAQEDAVAPEVQAALDSAGGAASDLVTRIAALSPPPRPARRDIADDAPSADLQSAVAFAGPTPRARPASLDAVTANTAPLPPAPSAEATRTGSATASAVASALGSLVPSVPADVVPVATSPYAVARSRVPETRPRNFDRNVERTTRQIEAAQAEPVRVASASAIVRPSGPTGGTVAQRATIANAINLRKVNLMGVYGSASNRRALIRLPSGKFEKVKVGDRVDGGRVHAIGPDALSYVKGGRQIVLRMPRG